MSSEPNESCAKDEILVRAFLNELTVRQHDDLIAHVLACPRCRLRFQALRQVKTALKESERLGKERRSRHAISLRLIGAVAGIVLIALSGFFLLSRYNKPGILRGQAEKLVLIEPSGRVLPPPSLFQWTPVKDTDIYRFLLIDDELNRVFVAATPKTSLRLPEDIRKKLVPKKTYVWIVEAYDDEPNKLDSAKRAFEIR